MNSIDMNCICDKVANMTVIFDLSNNLIRDLIMSGKHLGEYIGHVSSIT